MKLLLSIIFIVTLSMACLGQKSVAELKPTHAVALQEFLTKHKDYQFLSEKSIDADYLKFMRESLGKSLKPFYIVADFNHDRILDFALILSKKGKVKIDESITAEPHKYIYQLAVVVFNGNKKGGFKNVFIEDIEAPLACFLNLTNEKKKKLYFGVNETDEAFMMTPIGNGYIVENFDEP